LKSHSKGLTDWLLAGKIRRERLETILIRARFWDQRGNKRPWMCRW